MAIGKAIGVGLTALNIAQPYLDYSQAKKDGHSTSAAIGKGLLTYAAFELIPGLGWGIVGYELAKAGAQVAKKASDINLKNTSSSYRHGFGGNFIDTQASYTMRQQGLQAIQNNGINARTVLGNEARMFARGRYE